MPDFSHWLRHHKDAQSPEALERVRIAMARLPNVLERQTVAHQKTLEQKIADQGPRAMRVHPHLLGLAIRELAVERRTLRTYRHPSTGNTGWYATARTDEAAVRQKLDEIAPLYAQVKSGYFPNFVGDALEVVIFKALQTLNASNPRYSFDGAIDLEGPKTSDGRYRKIEPPNVISGYKTQKLADFVLYGFDSGPIFIECKNYREWIYPHHHTINELILKSIETRTTPLLIARRIHYTTLRNFLEPAGILAHETYYQYYPADQHELAARVKDKRLLGFSDVRATENPDPRTIKLFHQHLPQIVDLAAQRFLQNKQALSDYIGGDINLAQLYNAIGSPAAGNWFEPSDLSE